MVVWLGTLVIAGGTVELCQVVERGGDIGVVRTEGVLPDREAALVERLGARVVAGFSVERREGAERRR